MQYISTKEERIKEYMNDPNKINIVHKEIDLLQGVINRLFSNSQFCKKISLGFLVAFAPLAQILIAKGYHSDYSSLLLLFGTILATCFFCYMDCKYLMLEKKYRIGYEGIVGTRSRNWAFEFLYCLAIGSGTPGETRTPNSVRKADFESAASTSSTTGA